MPALFYTVYTAVGMGNLALLPTELLDQITSYVSRHDIENYAFTCRRIFRVSSTALQRHRARKQYTISEVEVWPFLQMSAATPSKCWEHHPVWLLRALLADPDLSPYVKHFKIAYGDLPGATSPMSHLVDTEDFTALSVDTQVPGRSQLEDFLQEGVEKRMLPYRGQIHELLQGQSPLGYYHIVGVLHGIMTGHRPSILALILLILQDIEKLTIVNCYRMDHHMCELFREMRFNHTGENLWGKLSSMDIGNSHHPCIRNLPSFIQSRSQRRQSEEMVPGATEQDA